MQPDATIPIPDSAPLASQGAELVQHASAVVVTNNGEYEAAGAELRRVANLTRRIKEAFAEPKRKAHEAHRAITKLESDLLALPAKAERILKEGMSTYLVAEERKRREEQARLQEEEFRKAQEAQLQEAVALDEMGETEAANQMLEAPAVAPVIELEKPRAAGISSRRKFRYQIIDASKIDRKFLAPDLAKIGGVVDRMGLDAAELVGGIRVFEDRIISSRAQG